MTRRHGVGVRGEERDGQSSQKSNTLKSIRPKTLRVGPDRSRLARTSSPILRLWGGNGASERDEQILTGVVFSL